MKYRVIKAHQSEFPNPIVISAGEKIFIGEKSDENEAWNDWYFCETLNKVSGWVPKQLIKWVSDNEGEALEDYSAKEMNTVEGEILIGSKVLNGWAWCKNPATQEEGWVPLENLVSI